MTTPTTISETGVTRGRALIVVDVQNDFCEGGALGVDGGAQVARDVTAYLSQRAADYAAVIATRDHHDADSDNGGHFAAPGAEPNFTTTWPVHCVADTTGSAYADGFDTEAVTHHVRKGMGEPAYSGFEGTVDTDTETGPGADTGQGATLTALLHDLGVTDVDVVGIATDYCVKQTVLDARREGFGVRVLGDMVAAVAPETGRAARVKMIEAGARWATPTSTPTGTGEEDEAR